MVSANSVRDETRIFIYKVRGSGLQFSDVLALSVAVRKTIELLRENAYVGFGLALVPLLLFSETERQEALLPEGSLVQWAFAAGSAVLFFGLLFFTFKSGFGALRELVVRAVFVGTVGIVLLFGFQWIADYSLQVRITEGSLQSRIALGIIQFIGFSYRCVSASQAGTLASPFLTFVGFIGGVGLCEEACKALPLFYDDVKGGGLSRLGWRGACVTGLACGVGFGVAEGVYYSMRFYNGSAGGNIYLVRFVSVVAFHGMLTGCSGILIWLTRKIRWTWFKALGVLSLSVVSHGVYDAFFGVGMARYANFTAVAVFLVFWWLVEYARGSERPAGSPWRDGIGKMAKPERAGFTSEELDLVLEKIARHGVESLTPGEYKLLQGASDEARRKKF